MSVILDDALEQGLYINEALSQNEPMTFAAYFKTDSLVDWQSMLCMAKSTSVYDYYNIGLGPDILGAGFYAVAEVREPGDVGEGHLGRALSTISPSANIWQCVVGTFNTTSSRSVLLDGTNEGIDTTPELDPLALNKTSIGYICRSPETWFMSGKIAEVAIWNAVLSEPEILQFCQGVIPTSIQPGNLLAYWPLLLDGDDASGNGKHLTGYNGPTFDGGDSPTTTPEITDQSASSTVLRGQETSLFITATGLPAPTYQWYLDGNPISGATSSTYTAYPTVTSTYTCMATNSEGSDITTPIVLTIVRNPYKYNPFNLPLDKNRTN